ncbi:N-acetyltransferase [Anaerovorax odorimutans]|uniref:N-acetyltransferase n=1 Tax=Anaerovorax odorimutans TaxID=109327 RepID=UPI0004161AC0|nr:N-acetyltransferase [Anaerovorax odorimutans]
MIINLLKEQTDTIMDIWLTSTIKAHYFIPEKYWKSNYETVKNEYIPNSKTYVFEDADGIIKGFISIIPNSISNEPNDSSCKSGMIGALFVSPEYQGNGVGGELLNFCKKNYDYLSLKVYSENKRAVDFYENYGFIIKSEQTDEETEQQEYIMNWSDDQDWYDLISTIQC